MSRIETYFLLLVVLNLCVTARMSCGMSSIGEKSGEAHRRKNPRGGYAFGTR